jgi:hypothetical protein
LKRPLAGSFCFLPPGLFTEHIEILGLGGAANPIVSY